MADTPGNGCRYCSSDVSHLAVVQDIANSREPHSRQTPHHVTVYCGVMRRCRRSRKTGFQHVLESGSSTAGRRYGKSPDDSRHDSRHDSTLESCLESCLESSWSQINQTGCRV
jgi:hypothetical protein